jgi:uncharacterized membrane protein
VPEPGEILRRPGSRFGRCSAHPSEPAIASCDVCERGLCLTCAIPVRGRVVGPECLASLVQDLPEQPVPPSPRGPRGDVLALCGFALVLVASIFPWARFGEADTFGEAWTPHWSLLAVVPAAVGIVAVIVMRRRHVAAAAAASVDAALAALIALGALLHATRPPPLSNAAGTWPWRFALVGAFLVLLAAARKAIRPVTRRPAPA